MSQIPTSLLGTSWQGPSQFFKMLQQLWQKMAAVVNGNLSFGNSISGADNINGKWVSVTFATPNVDQTVTHNLGRIPAGYWSMSKVAACDVYTGSVVATKTQITLRGTVATTVVLFII